MERKFFRRLLEIDKRYKEWFPYHYHKFCIMHEFNKVTDFPRDTKGFILFVNTLGVPPPWMKSPSLGRKDHTKGYTVDNITWQDWIYNQAEAHFRNMWLLPKGFTSFEQLRRRLNVS